MKMKKVAALVLTLVMVLTLAACGGNTTSPGTSGDSTDAPDGSTTTDTVYNITIGHGAAEDTSQHQCALAIKEYLEANSNGRFKVTIFPNNQLGANREMTEAVLNGELTLMLTTSGTQTSFVPDCAVLDIPYSWASTADMENTIEDEDFLAALDASNQAAGFKLMMLTHRGFRQLSANKAIHTPDDCKGLIVRTQENAFQMKTWELCGANVTPLAFNELYTALQQGTVEAQENSLELFTSQAFYEQQDYFMKTNYLGDVGLWICNLDFYNNLPDDLREMFDYACKEVGLERNKEYCETSTQEKEEFLREYGCTIIDLTDEEREAFREAVTPVWDDIQNAVSSEVWDAYMATLA